MGPEWEQPIECILNLSYIEKFSRLRTIIGFVNFLMVTAAAYLNLFISNTRRHHFDDDVSICYVCRENTITANWQSEKPSAT